MRRYAFPVMSLACLLATPAAASVRLELSIERLNVGIGEPFSLTLKVTAPGNTRVRNVQIANVSEFTVSGSPEVSTEFQVDWGRGVSNTVRTYRYVLRPRRTGSFLLGPAVASAGGATVRSNTVALKVVSGSTAMRATDDQMFMVAKADTTTAYVGQQVTVSYWLYSRVSYYGLELRKEPTTDGFWVEELDVPRGVAAYRRTNIGGVPYRAQLLKRQALFPLRVGTLTVGSFVLDAQVGMRFFGGGRNLTRGSPELRIQVRPLPASGRPKDFHEQNVGTFSLRGGVDRKQVKMGEAVKYRIQLEGQGNIKNLILPKLPEGQGYRSFDPSPKISRRIENNRVVGTRTLEYLLSATRPGQFVVPPLVFHYFDPRAGRYRSATIPRQVVNVAGAPSMVGGAAPPPQLAAGADPDLKDVRPQPELRPPSPPLHRSGLFWILLVAPVLLYVALLLWGRLRALRTSLRLRGEPRRKAAEALGRLRRAQALVASDNPTEFYAHITAAVLSMLEVKLGEPMRGLTLPELRTTLVSRGFADELAAETVSVLEQCDFGRFAQADSRGEEMRSTHARAKSLVDRIESVRPLPRPKLGEPQEAS